MEIAVLAGNNGAIAPLQEATELQVYLYSCGGWTKCRSMPLDLPSGQGLPGMRKYMQAIVEFLGECRTLVGLSIIGLPFFELEKAGFTIWEMAGSPLIVLDSILEAEASSSASPPLNIIMPRPEPQEISPDCYSISLIDIQNRNGQITSKQILFPLLKKMEFRCLEIICSHVPPWLEQQIITGQLNGQVNQVSRKETRVTINGKPSTQ